MPGRLGTRNITAIRYGNRNIKQMRRGNKLLWSGSLVRDDFKRADAPTLGPDWALHDPNDWLGQPQPYHAGVVNKMCRVSIPDGTAAYPLVTGRARLTKATATKDDGYVEVRAATIGSPITISSLTAGYITQVFGRLSNGAFTDGVGLQLNNGNVSIVKRVGSADVLVKPDGSAPPDWWEQLFPNNSGYSDTGWGTFQAGQIIRLAFRGPIYELWVGGVYRGQWDSTGSNAKVGSGYRSLGVRVDAAIDLLGSPNPDSDQFWAVRRFSPALDYVEYA